jgi:hypothetical protein
LNESLPQHRQFAAAEVITAAKEAQQTLHEPIKALREWMQANTGRPRILKRLQAQLAEKQEECTALETLYHVNEELVNRLEFWPAKFYDIGKHPARILILLHSTNMITAE